MQTCESNDKTWKKKLLRVASHDLKREVLTNNEYMYTVHVSLKDGIQVDVIWNVKLQFRCGSCSIQYLHCAQYLSAGGVCS